MHTISPLKLDTALVAAIPGLAVGQIRSTTFRGSAVAVALVGSWLLGLGVVGVLADRLGRRTPVVDEPGAAGGAP